MHDTASSQPAASSTWQRRVISTILFVSLLIGGFWLGQRSGYQRGYTEALEQKLSGPVIERTYDVSDLVFPYGMDRNSTPPDIDSLMELITMTTEPVSWDDVGGRGLISPTPDNLSVIISQTEKVHAEIAELLTKLRTPLFLNDISTSFR